MESSYARKLRRVACMRNAAGLLLLWAWLKLG